MIELDGKTSALKWIFLEIITCFFTFYTLLPLKEVDNISQSGGIARKVKETRCPFPIHYQPQIALRVK